MTNQNDPFAWLGLLKWSLAYTDGTKPAEESPRAMSQEDREFLESVIREGIIDEGQRMKTILNQVTNVMQEWTSDQKIKTQEQIDGVQDLLQELRDIIEQIDYARAFAAMKGLDFLLGCATTNNLIPDEIKSTALAILSTMVQHNPPLQKELIERGALKELSDLFFEQSKLRPRIIQCISAIVRSHDLAEAVFVQLPQATALVEAGLLDDHSKERSLLFLHALVLSDSSTKERIDTFYSSIRWTAEHLTRPDQSLSIRETSLDLLTQLLEQQKNSTAVLAFKEGLVSRGVKRVAELRKLDGEEKDAATIELQHWEKLLVLLWRTSPPIK